MKETPSSIRRVALALVGTYALCGSSVCGASPGSPVSPPDAGSEPVVAAASTEVAPKVKVPEGALGIAGQWMTALKAADLPGLRDQTIFPFGLKSTNRQKLCEGTAQNSAAFASMVHCLNRRRKVTFVGEMESWRPADLKVIDVGSLPTTLRKMVGTPAPDEKLVETFINGEGVVFEFVLVVKTVAGRSGVNAVISNAEFEAD
jgi:hypothetical protein